MSPLLYHLASLLLRLYCYVTRPTAITCAPGHSLEGVRIQGPSRGESACVASYLDRTRDDREGYPTDAPKLPRFEVRVYCREGTEPRVLSERRVACVQTRGARS